MALFIFKMLLLLATVAFLCTLPWIFEAVDKFLEASNRRKALRAAERERD